MGEAIGRALSQPQLSPQEQQRACNHNWLACTTETYNPAIFPCEAAKEAGEPPPPQCQQGTRPSGNAVVVPGGPPGRPKNTPSGNVCTPGQVSSNTNMINNCKDTKARADKACEDAQKAAKENPTSKQMATEAVLLCTSAPKIYKACLDDIASQGACGAAMVRKLSLR